MTDRERARIEETKRAMIALYPMCQLCGLAPSIQLAHVIPQTRGNLRKYGKRIIHHPSNLRAVCSLACNSAASLGCNPVAEAALVARIGRELAYAKGWEEVVT